MIFTSLSIPDVLKIEPKVFSDERGCFFEYFRCDEFFDHNLPPLVQDNCSHSKFGVFRGLHYQKNPRAQGKLVRCSNGAILDVVVDIRPFSPTFKQHLKVILRDETMLWVPVGFAHGFVSLTNYTKVCYRVSEYYSPEHERSISIFDPDLKIDLGLDFKLVMSDKDKNAPYLKDADNNF